MGGFSNFAISFTIISILAGCLTSYFIAFNRRPGRDHLGLAHRRLLRPARRARDGRSRVGDADGRRDLLLVVEARIAGLGLVLGLVQPDRPDRRDGGDRLRRRRLLDGAAQPVVPGQHQHRHAHGLRDVQRDRGSASAPEPERRAPARSDQLDLSVVAHGRRRGDRGRPDRRARPSPVGVVRLHEDDQRVRIQRQRASRARCSGSCSGSAS